MDIRKRTLGERHPSVAESLRNLGYSYFYKENYKLAIGYFKESLVIYKKSLGEAHPSVADTLGAIGQCYSAKGDNVLAISFHQKALAILRKKFVKKHAKIAKCLNNLGSCHADLQDYESSIDCFQEALTSVSSSFDSKNIYFNPSLKEYNDGYKFLNALYGKTKTLIHFYEQEPQNIKYLKAALSTITLASELVADIRRSYKAEGSKHSLAEKSAKIYNQAVDIVLQTSNVYRQLPQIPQHAEFANIPYTTEGAENLAFDFAEQSKAVLLLSNLKDNEAKVTSNIPTKLLEKEKQLKIELNYLEKGITTQNGKGVEKDEALLTKFQRQYFEQKQQYDALIEQFETDYPEYYQLKYSVSTASVQDLQSYLLGNSPFEGEDVIAIQQSNHSTIILSYHIAEEKIYIFAISSNDYQIVSVEKPSNFSQLIEKLQEDIQLGHVTEFIQSATELFDILLRPVWDFLQESSKLTIIPHGELYYVPFDVLLNQHQVTDTKNFENLPYLIRNFDISYHYSATLLLHSHQRQLQTGEQVDSFFGLAPVHFGGNEGSEKKEGYVVKSSGKQAKRNRRILKSSGNAQEALEDLEETELEVKEVYQLFEEQGKEAIALFYDQANKQNLKEHIGGYKYVLISTHGFLQESGKNMLSGIHLASRQTVDDGRKSTDDFILHTSETYHLNLNADLVVLSSCESGVGELKVGEGMMALNRGFLYAGASNIVYSLFQVPEDSTRQLVETLFRYILEGENYGAALRKAKLDLINDGVMEPMDWAGFALVGG